MLPSFDFSYPGKIEMNIQTQRILSEHVNSMMGPAAASMEHVGSSAVSYPSLKNCNICETLNFKDAFSKNFKNSNFALNNNFAQFATLPGLPMFPPPILGKFTEAQPPTKRRKEDYYKAFDNELFSTKVGCFPSPSAPTSANESTTDTKFGNHFSFNHTLTPPPTPQALPFSFDFFSKPNETPNLLASFPPAWWKINNMMLANHILNSHFIQTVKDSLQQNVNSEKSSPQPKNISPSLNEKTLEVPISGPALLQHSKNTNRSKDEKELHSITSNTLSSFSTKSWDFHTREGNPFPSSEREVLPQNPFKLPHTKDTLTKNIQATNEAKNSLSRREIPIIHPFPPYFSIMPNKSIYPYMFMPSSKKSALHRPYSFKPSFQPHCTNLKNSTPIVLSMGSKVSVKDKKSHRCAYCGKLYSRKYGLKIHIRTHTGYKPLKCKICGRPFGDPSNLNKHVRLHAEGATPYRCQFCGKVLVRRRDLERHINSRHPEQKSSAIGTSVKCPPADPRLWSAK